MTKEKAQYKGQALTGSMPIEIPEKLRHILKDLCPNKQPADPPWPSPAEVFAALLIDKARRAVSFLFSQEEHITKGQARAESDDLLKTLRSLNDTWFSEKTSIKSTQS